jgi:hypothetical protein
VWYCALLDANFPIRVKVLYNYRMQALWLLLTPEKHLGLVEAVASICVMIVETGVLMQLWRVSDSRPERACEHR